MLIFLFAQFAFATNRAPALLTSVTGIQFVCISVFLPRATMTSDSMTFHDIARACSVTPVRCSANLASRATVVTKASDAGLHQHDDRTDHRLPDTSLHILTYPAATPAAVERSAGGYRPVGMAWTPGLPLVARGDRVAGSVRVPDTSLHFLTSCFRSRRGTVANLVIPATAGISSISTQLLARDTGRRRYDGVGLALLPDTSLHVMTSRFPSPCGRGTRGGVGSRKTMTSRWDLTLRPPPPTPFSEGRATAAATPLHVMTSAARPAFFGAAANRALGQLWASSPPLPRLDRAAIETRQNVGGRTLP